MKPPAPAAALQTETPAPNTAQVEKPEMPTPPNLPKGRFLLKAPLPPDNVVQVAVPAKDMTNLRKMVRGPMFIRNTVCFYSARGLDNIVGKLEQDFRKLHGAGGKQAASGDPAAPGMNHFTFQIPSNFIVPEMDIYMRVSRKTLRLQIYQKAMPRDVLLLDTPVALGGWGFHHAHRQFLSEKDSEYALLVSARDGPSRDIPLVPESIIPTACG